MALLQPGQGGKVSDIGLIMQASAALPKAADLSQTTVGANSPVNSDRPRFNCCEC